MRAEPDQPRPQGIAAAVEQAEFGLLLFDRDLALVQATAPVGMLVPAWVGRLTPGTACASLMTVGIGPEGRVELTLPPNCGHLRLGAQTLPDGGLLVLLRDASTERHDAARLADVIEGGTVGTWEWEVETGEMRVNDRWITMLGHSRADLEPICLETWRGLLHPADQARMAGMYEHLLHSNEIEFDQAFRLRHANGGWVWVQSRGRVLRRTDAGVPRLMAGVHMDITVQKAFEHRLEQVLEGAQVGTWQFDEMTQHNQIDARWAEMLGYTLDEVTRRPGNFFAGLLHPDDRPQLVAEQDGRMRNGTWKFDNEFRLRHKDGHWVWVLSRGRVTEWSDDGQPLQTSGVHIDISDRKALSEALALERDFLAGLMETSISGIMALNAEGQVIFVNREAETIMGRPAARLMGQSCKSDEWGLTDPDGRPLGPETSPFHLAITAGQPQRGLRLMVRWPDGTLRQLLVNAAPLARAGVAAAVVCAIADISDAVAAEADLRAAMERAEAGNRAKSAFLATMSHEIRTPLNGVLGMADVLGATLTTPEQRAMLDTIQQSGAHLLSVLNDILDLAKIESGRMTLETRAFVPCDLARRIEALHRLTAGVKGVDLRVRCDTGSALPRLGDAQRVLQVMHNLVGNAVKFTEAGEVSLVITAHPGSPLRIEVSDTGIGMSADQVSQVFQDFIQGDDTITRRFGGTGLGLPIVKRLVALIGGTIQLDSTPGAGTRVRVDLPLPLAPPPAAEAPRTLPQLPRLRALVAEDNATNRVILRSMLTSLGLGFTLVEDGEQALAEWAPDQFDILLLDISMPHRDGVSALQAIRERAQGAGVACPPALAVTANAMTHHLAEYIGAGFAGIVAKPIRVEDLAQAIANAVTEPAPG